MSYDFHSRKQERTDRYFKFEYGFKLRTCVACNGSGYYDHSVNGRTPKCASCNGTGKERYKDESVLKK